jgi:hypothetical protein
LQLTFTFPTSPDSAELGSGNRWCSGQSELDEFRDFMLANPAFLMKADADSPDVSLHHEYV